MLKTINPEKLIEREIASVYAGYIYYVFSGRNAWHSTWVTQYSDGCMHTSKESAKRYAESMQVQGSVFYLRQLPCLCFTVEEGVLVVTEINCKSPLSGYSLEATTKEVAYGQTKIEGALDNYLVKGAPLKGVALSFKPESRFWKNRPAPRHSVIYLSANTTRAPEVLDEGDYLEEYRSCSQGGRCYLGWLKVESWVNPDGIFRIKKFSNHGFSPSKV